MVETLTERNLDLEEKVRELRETVTDLVSESQHPKAHSKRLSSLKSVLSWNQMFFSVRYFTAVALLCGKIYRTAARQNLSGIVC